MSRPTFLAILIYALILGGLATLRGGMFLLAIPLLAYVAVGLWHAPRPPQLAIGRAAPTGTAAEGELVPITLTIHNEGTALAELLVVESLPAGLSIDSGDTQLLTYLAEKETAELTYTVAVQRGTFDVSGTAVVLRDPLGLFTWAGVPPVTTHLTVIPRYQQLRLLPLRPPRTMGFSGPLSARQSGAGTNFWGVREYQLGDPLRRVNWRTSARYHEQLFTTEYQQERIADISLIVDARREHMLAGRGESLLDHEVRATAALADSLLRDGHRVGLFLYGYGLDGVLPGYGKGQRERILRKLAEARPGSQLFRTLHYLPVRLFPAGAQLIFISPLAEGDETMLFRLRARGYGVLVVSPNAVEFEAQLLAQRQTPAHPLAIRLARLERQGFLRQLRQAGITTVDWPVNESLDEALQVALGQDRV